MSLTARRLADLVRKAPPPVPSCPIEGPRRVDADAVAWAYRLLLNREPEPLGSGNNLRVFGGKPLEEMMVQFLTCLEFRQSPLYERTRDFRHQRPVWVPLDGYSIWVSPDDVEIGGQIADRGEYEPHVTAAVREILREGDTFVDVGANIGWFTLLAASIVGPSGKVVAVEPNPGNVISLTNSITCNDFTWARVLPYAAGAEVTTVRLLGGRGTNAYFDMRATAKEDGWRDSSVVPVRPLDDLLQDVGRVDVLKIDVEGVEGLVVDGAENVLRSSRPTILCEFGAESLVERSNRTGDRFVDQLIELGYSVSHLSASGERVRLADGQAALRAEADHGETHIDLLCEPQPVPAHQP